MKSLRLFLIRRLVYITEITLGEFWKFNDGNHEGEFRTVLRFGRSSLKTNRYTRWGFRCPNPSADFLSENAAEPLQKSHWQEVQ